MKIENPAALSFILQDEIYLLDQDKINTAGNPAPVAIAETPAVQFKYLGGYKKKLLVLTYYRDVEFMNATHLEAFNKVLNRLNFAADDIAIINIADYTGSTFSKILEFFRPQKMLVLGADALPVGIEPLTLNMLTHLNNCHVLLSFSFDEMMDNQEYKKAFWEEMKKL